ncbi:uncharacterized protein LOC105690450 [Athalia rosae]|uniref:uncharacterized protein LOC105690450 n=1 Tax=Athalia rosae TaxID=37344 RepID=UPI002033C239|nr:uncharacterized protein LOC105690450 [Athalia rosae]
MGIEEFRLKTKETPVNVRRGVASPTPEIEKSQRRFEGAVKMKILIIALFAFGVPADCSSLLEMSQVLWSRLLAGGLIKGGPLDPLRIPVVKVDQSEGNTSYRIVLRNVEVRGLNLSTLESVHLARGRLKSNLSELEAGYVSYADLRELDSIRYRFHTLVKERKPKNVNAGTDEFPKEDADFVGEPEPTTSAGNGATTAASRNPPRVRPDAFRTREELVDVVYAAERRPYDRTRSGNRERADNYRADGAPSRIVCFGSCDTGNGGPHSRGFTGEGGRNGNSRRRDELNDREGESAFGNRDAQTSGSESFELKRAFVGTGEPGGAVRSTPESRNSGHRGNGNVGDPKIRDEGARGRINDTRVYDRTPPGYVDIVYADMDDRKIRRFGGFPREDDRDVGVRGLHEIRKEIERRNRYFVHNFTETEAIQKRNNMTRAAIESKAIKDLIRYADNYQEKNGYYEQGMRLIYHLGGAEDPSPVEPVGSNEAKRRKRQHDLVDASEDDVMHVIVRLRVPLLRVKADYLLGGKVGPEVLRGNGQLTGNFTNLTGDFTLELKRIGEKKLVVRAARARLISDGRKVTLQGMKEKGPVQSILVHGLMAAEAVAAMIADDLATKALGEQPATDAMIYKMYSNDPASLQD